MSSALSQDRLYIYEKLHSLAENLVVGFDDRKIWLTEHEDSGVNQIFDVVDDVYAEGKEDMGLDYQDVQILAAIAVIRASEFKAADDMSPGDGRFDD